jgi:mannose-6-phosphate isomerase-like protein (cupin superfamily)
MHTSPAPKIVGPRDGKAGSLGSIGVRFMIDTDETYNGGFSLVEHPMGPRKLAAPLHRHSREDEYSYVLEGRMGALLGDDEVYADAGDFVFKPRDQWHTFWNAGDEPCRILEIIAPGGFEHMFREMGELTSDPDPAKLADFSERYGIQFDPEGTTRVAERFGLVQNYVPDEAATAA